MEENTGKLKYISLEKYPFLCHDISNKKEDKTKSKLLSKTLKP